jgi:hypothetical protein
MRVLLMVLVATLGATSAWLWRELQREREHVEESQAEIALARSDYRRPDAERPGPTIPGSVESQDASHPDYFEQTRFKRGLVFSGSDPRLQRNSEYMDARRRYLRAAFAQRYPDLTRVLGVPEETAFRVVELSHEEQLRASSVTVDANRPDFWLEQQQQAYESDRAIAALIGETGLGLWKEYEASNWERHQVRALRLELIDSAEPLDGDEAEKLIHALYEERQRFEEEAGALSGPTGGEPGAPSIAVDQDAAGHEAELERRTLEAAKELLSSYQFETYRDMVVRQRTAQHAMDEMERIGMQVLN